LEKHHILSGLLGLSLLVAPNFQALAQNYDLLKRHQKSGGVKWLFLNIGASSPKSPKQSAAYALA
jgi:hypothetical protein